MVRIDMEADTTQPFNTQDRTGSTDLGLCVWGLESTVSKGVAQIVGTHGLTHIDFALLRLFLEVEEWTATQLAQALPLGLPGVSRLVTKLVDRGLIQRRRLLSDRRVLILTLTAEGMALTRNLHRRVLSYHTTLCEGVSKEEVEAFASVSSRVMANYTALEQSNPPPNRTSTGPAAFHPSAPPV